VSNHSQPVSPEQGFALVARRTQVPLLAGEWQQEFMSAIRTTDPGAAGAEQPALNVSTSGAVDVGQETAEARLEAILVDGEQGL